MEKAINPTAIQQMVCYYYLVNFWVPEYIESLVEITLDRRKKLAKDAGLSLNDFTERVIPEVSTRIVAFHQATRKPDENTVSTLSLVMRVADLDPKGTGAFQIVMEAIAGHPARAKLDNRLHRRKGCALCSSPCQYGFFTLMSEPDFKRLKALLDIENKKLAPQRDAVNALWTFATTHIWENLGAKNGYIQAKHLGNLSYCLLMLGTAKSRFALREKELKAYQKMNQGAIQRLDNVPIHLKIDGRDST